MVLYTSESPPFSPSTLVPPIESTSSINIKHGACYLANKNSSLTIRAPSPIYFWTNSEPETLINVQSVWWAIALANKVFPVPGGP